MASLSTSTEEVLQSVRGLLEAKISDPPFASTRHSLVFKTHSQIYRCMVAVKIVDKKSLPSSIAEKFLPRELDITAKVRHPHLARCLCMLQTRPQKIVMVSVFYPGGTLLDLVLRQHRIKENPSGVRLFRQLIEALNYLHERGIVHRDVKLENILLDASGDVRLADFGFARHISKRERSRSFCGTRPYSAPQIIQYKEYDPYAADWFATGIVLYTMLVGKWPKEQSGGTARPTLSFPQDVPSPPCRRLIHSLLDEEEDSRASYEECAYSEWMSLQPQWVFADHNFVYETVRSGNVAIV